jgi:hypothetical protein
MALYVFTDITYAGYHTILTDKIHIRMCHFFIILKDSKYINVPFKPEKGLAQNMFMGG